jgi:hypothetical protein
VNGALDIVKEFVRGKLVDQAYVHLGVLGRWLLAYPVAFFTLGLCLIILLVVGATMRELFITEDSAIYDEHGNPYETQLVSPNWTVSLVIYCGDLHNHHFVRHV